MLCFLGHDVSYPKPNQIILKDKNLNRFECSLSEGDLFAVFSKNYTISIYSIKKAQKNGDFYIIHFQVKKKLVIHEKIQKSLFYFNTMIQLEEEDLKKISELGLAIEKQQIVLQVKAKLNNYVRFIFLDGNENIFNESYIQWEEWESWEKEMLVLKSDIDFCIQHKQIKEIDEKKIVLKELLMKLLDRLKIPNGVKKLLVKSYQIIHIYWDAPGIFIPFEALSEKLLVKNHVLIKHINDSNEALNFIMIYSNQLKSSHKEVAALAEILKEKWNIEYFSDQNYEDYKSNLRKSKILHFSGHGIIEDKKGKIIMKNKNLEEIHYAKNLKMVFLNCCLTGMVTEGIIHSLIRGNGGLVIASPFQIPDETEKQTGFIQYFYSLLNPDDFHLCYFLALLKFPEIGFYYRNFTGYYDKI